ncbi:hypothetical protein NXX52_28785 [Bacteroides ovatus]|nr:hypothetical protein [Bacteroides ovatus]
MLTSENNANRLNQGHLQAIAVSGYRPLLELEGKLLLAAKLQEGLRQAIVETMDEGCPESYLHLFSVICDNGTATICFRETRYCSQYGYRRTRQQRTYHQ